MGDYSLSQMDNFYLALATGIVKSSGVMNYIQHLTIASECSEGDHVLDICCGRGLLVPLLRVRASHIASYTGVDISEQNLAEAVTVIQGHYSEPPSFRCSLLRADVATLPLSPASKFDVIAYTSSIEHLPRAAAVRSLLEVRKHLAPNGVLFISTPNTPGARDGRRQYKVHVHEWEYEDLARVIEDSGFEVRRCIGLLAPDAGVLEAVLLRRFGDAAVCLWREMKASVPSEFLDPVIASVATTCAREVLLRCHLRGQT